MKTRTLTIAGLGYLVVLAAVLIAGAVVFRDLYGTTRPSQGAEFAPIYQSFLLVTGAFLALYLGIWAGFFGVVHRRWWLGAAGLALGAGLTVAGLSVLPWILFPHDQYAAGAAWIFSGLPVCMGAWAVVTVVGTIRRRATDSADDSVGGDRVEERPSQ